MLSLVVFIYACLLVFLYYRVSIFLNKKISFLVSDLARYKQEYKRLEDSSNKLKSGNIGLEKFSEQIIALYDITKEICKTLDKDEVFDIFRKNINSYIRVGDCRFIQDQDELKKYPGYRVIPLSIEKQTLGYLLVNQIHEKDELKFRILATQFIAGIKRASLYQKIQETAITDSLTQALSRRYFFERLQEEVKRSLSFKLKFSFLMIDVDHFKECNDKYGHLVGDAILREVAKIIRDNIRQIDFLGRYGGEEITVVLPETAKKEASFAAERIRKAVAEKRLSVYDEQIAVTISIGIATFLDDAVDSKNIIEKADKALYLAKEKGRNRVWSYG